MCTLNIEHSLYALVSAVGLAYWPYIVHLRTLSYLYVLLHLMAIWLWIVDLEGSKLNLPRPVEDTVTSFVWRDVINARNVCYSRTPAAESGVWSAMCIPEKTLFFFCIQSYSRINSAISPASGASNVSEPAVMWCHKSGGCAKTCARRSVCFYIQSTGGVSAGQLACTCKHGTVRFERLALNIVMQMTEDCGCNPATSLFISR